MLLKKVFGRLKDKKANPSCLVRLMLLVLVFLSVGYSEATAVSRDKVDVNAVCKLIYHGKFEVAGNLLRQFDPNGRSVPDQLAGIVFEYKAIEQKRCQTKEAAYKEKLEELDKLQLAADTNEVNDINDISKVLGVIIRTNEFANEKQKQDVLARQFVKETIQKAANKASEYESKGDWLDAYAVYYNLKLIYKDNEAYEDYSEQLITKANIVASFQDSPCQTSRERYAGVKKEMFIRTIDALNFSYVNIIDYHQMAAKAIERCKLLTEVIRLSFSQIKESITASSAGEKYVFSFTPPDDRQLSAWSLGLKAILNEVEQSFPSMTKDRFINVFEEVLVLNSDTVQFPQNLLIAQFAEASLYSLDPYTVIVWPKHVSEFEKAMTNAFTGIGIRLQKEKGLLKVASLLPDTPAYRSGMDAGDIIEKVDGDETKDMTITCAVKKITGPQGTKVTLTIRRPEHEEKSEDKIWDIVITRAKIVVPPVRGWQRTEEGRSLYMLDEQNKIGYVYISSFDSRTSGDFEKVLVKLEKASMKALLIDLRGNPGGLLPSAIEVADKFIKKGLIVSTRPRFGVWTWEYAKRKTHPDYPIVILVNSGSASASEIVSGALADKTYERAILVGDRTHGKGSVQSITSYPGGGAQLKYTMAHYHLPSGQRVESREMMEKRGREDWGVGPNVKIKLRSDELRKKYDAHWDNLVLARADHNNETKPLKKHTAKELIASDQQLAVGILVLKAKLIQQKNSLQAGKN